MGLGLIGASKVFSYSQSQAPKWYSPCETLHTLVGELEGSEKAEVKLAKCLEDMKRRAYVEIAFKKKETS